jgi:pyridinium-3,5-bisthiocarboxylic acid mononucleotide nickel chelatase
MRILRFDSVGGASGDMILASLCALGVSPYEIRSRLSVLALDPFDILAEPAEDHGVHGLRVTVQCHQHAHAHRHYSDIRVMIGSSELPERVKHLSQETFRRLAVAEGAVHGVSPDEVHFHEVGAMDSIVDVIGSCIALDMLGVDAVCVSPLPMGSGVVQCAHGLLPIPAPATVELLRGSAVVQTAEPFETVTPTGAALLVTWTSVLRAAEPGAPATVGQCGHGIGHRRMLQRPNLLRATILESVAAGTEGDECTVLECNIDDSSPELIGALAVRLMEAGALDVFTVPAQMKKQRPGSLLTALCRTELRDRLVDMIFAESTTFGIRERTTRRIVLPRRIVEVSTPYGTVRIKIGAWKGRDVTRSPEYEDCVRCADRSGVPVRMVYEAAIAAMHTP